MIKYIDQKIDRFAQFVVEFYFDMKSQIQSKETLENDESI